MFHSVTAIVFGLVEQFVGGGEHGLNIMITSCGKADADCYI